MTETKAYKLLTPFLIALPILGLIATPAVANNTIMGMAYIQEIVIQTPRIGNLNDSKKCGLSENSISDFVLQKLRKEQLPVFSLIDAPKPKKDVARLYIVPEATTMEVRNFACVSYISLTAKAQATLPIPPIEVPRHITISYWGAGLMVNSSHPGHKRVTEAGFEKLATLFARQYKLAQPPVISLEKEERILF